VIINADFLLTISIKETGKILFIYLYCTYSAQIVLGFPLLFFEGKQTMLLIIDEIFFRSEQDDDELISENRVFDSSNKVYVLIFSFNFLGNSSFRRK